MTRAAGPAGGGSPRIEAQPSDRTRVRRLPDRGRYDRATIDAILDEALFCHVGFLDGGQPFVVPTIHARAGDLVYVHGSTGSRMLRALSDGAPACLTATILDGLVFARSAFDHSMNYRSAMVLGTAREVVDRPEKLAAMRAIVEHVAPGRWEEIRAPNPREFAATTILSIPLDETSAKVRSGPPHDDEEDLALPVWAGELPVMLAALDPRPDPLLARRMKTSPSVAGWRRRSGAGAGVGAGDPPPREGGEGHP